MEPRRLGLEQQPLWIWIDPTRECGLKCRFCYTKRSHGSDHLSIDRLRLYLDILLDDAGALLQKLNFNWRGDPLMNPSLLELLEELEGRRLPFPTEFHTNGTTLDDSTAQSLVATLDHVQIFVSIDGGNEASHDFNRGSGTYRKALAGLARLLEARGVRKRPRIGVFQLSLGVPEACYDPDFVRLASAADEWVRINPIHPTTGQRLRPQVSVGTVAGLDDSVPPLAVSPDDRWWAQEVPASAERPQGPCFWAGNALFIAPDGDAYVCLLSHAREGVLGNLLTTPLNEIVERGNRFRRDIERLTRSGVEHCARCRVAEGVPVPIRLRAQNEPCARP